MNKAEKFRRLTCTQELRKDLRGSSVRAAAFTWAAGAVDFVLRIGSTAILARLILPEQFELVMMVMAVTAIVDQFRGLDLSTVTVQRNEMSQREVSNLFPETF
jgi:O-antigen/teichoic acid export membrane protein